MSNNNPLRILLADDDDDDTFLFQEALKQVAIKTDLIVAENGIRLMQILNHGNFKPDLIFLDMNMPVKNGLECLAEIRSLEGFEHVRVVILSTSVARYMLDTAYEGGADLYIQKPTTFSGLVDVLEKCLISRLPEGPRRSMEQFLITN